MEKYNIFLDDVRRPEDAAKYMHLDIYDDVEWIIVRNYYAFISLIEKKGMPSIISFDHDLAPEHHKKREFDYDDNKEKTGFHCAKWFLNYCLDNKKDPRTKIIIHSMNPYGSLNILSIFESFYKVFNMEFEPIEMLAAKPR